jgi:hypothetical protein
MARRKTTKAAPKRKKPTLKRKACTPRFPLQRQFEFSEPGQGRYFNLRAIFDKMNERYFGNRLKRYQIVWGRRRPERPREIIVFGTIQEEDRIIRIHPLLDRVFVPAWFVEYVVYHEMLHAFVPDEYDSAGRRRVHHEKFLAREKKFHWFRRAKVWEQENLGRFLA